jgi:hypothetical protein
VHSQIHVTADLSDLDDPLAPATSSSSRAPLTGNLSSGTSRPPNQSAQSYLSSAIPGEDRRAPQNTIDESVWETLSRDLSAVWEKMRQVLWPKYLLGGMLMQSGADGVEGAAGIARGFGRWPDADAVLGGSMSDGLRDWDLWYVRSGGLVCYGEGGCGRRQ